MRLFKKEGGALAPPISSNDYDVDSPVATVIILEQQFFGWEDLRKVSRNTLKLSLHGLVIGVSRGLNSVVSYPELTLVGALSEFSPSPQKIRKDR